MMIINIGKKQHRPISINSNMENYTVYIHTNISNGKKYIGITSMNPSIRWKNGFGYKKQKRFYSAIQHYGWDGFTHEVIASGLSKEQAEQMEVELISRYKSNDLRFGYNIENGGVTNKLSEEQKRHISEVNKGKHHSEETKAKMSQSHKGKSTKWLTGRKASEDTKRKMSAKRKGTLNGRAKAVYQYRLDGSFVCKYDYMDLTKEALGIKSTGHISSCCLGQRGKAHGFMWSYEFKTMAPYERARKVG